LVAAFDVHARMDAIHPTPIYELLSQAEQLADLGNQEMAGGGGVVGTDEKPGVDLCRLVPSVEAALDNLHFRSLDDDGNGGVVLHKLG